MKKVVAVIPARGGSRRIPNKNIVEFGGRPMIVRTLEAAAECEFFDRLLVSTDSEQIAEVVSDLGYDVPFLRDTAADEQATASEATLRALEQLEEVCGERYERVVQLMPNCPFRTADDIRRMMEDFDSHNSDFLISCGPYEMANPWWAYRIDAAGRGEPLFPDKQKVRSQDLETVYCPSGAVWIANVEALRKAGTFYGESFRLYPLSWKSSIDIDTPEELRLAEALLSLEEVGV